MGGGATVDEDYTLTLVPSHLPRLPPVLARQVEYALGQTDRGAEGEGPCVFNVCYDVNMNTGNRDINSVLYKPEY